MTQSETDTLPSQMEQQLSKGVMYIVATPIGNLQDMTLRAKDTLSNVHTIIAENPQVTRKLLTHFGISTPIIPYREDNHDRVIGNIITTLKDGHSIALVSDAGTPVISDPGIKLLRECYAQNIPVIPIPGASAVTSAVSVFPVPSPKFVFLGFFPRQFSEFKKWFEQSQDFILKEKVSYVAFESPHRIRKTLEGFVEFAKELSEKYTLKIGLASEISKLHETFLWSAPDALLSYRENGFSLEKGEYTIVVSFVKNGKQQDDNSETEYDEDSRD